MEYLERPLIEDVSYEISERRVSIQSPSTCFVNCVLPERCRKDLMLAQYQRVLRLAKEQGVRISYSRHIRRTIQESWPDYVAGREAQEQLFQELCEAAHTVQQRGIHLGHADDEAIAKVHQIRNALDKLRFSDKAVRKTAECEYELYMLEQRLSSGRAHWDMIAL